MQEVTDIPVKRCKLWVLGPKTLVEHQGLAVEKEVQAGALEGDVPVLQASALGAEEAAYGSFMTAVRLPKTGTSHWPRASLRFEGVPTGDLCRGGISHCGHRGSASGVGDAGRGNPQDMAAILPHGKMRLSSMAWNGTSNFQTNPIGNWVTHLTQLFH